MEARKDKPILREKQRILGRVLSAGELENLITMIIEKIKESMH